MAFSIIKYSNAAEQSIEDVQLILTKSCQRCLGYVVENDASACSDCFNRSRLPKAQTLKLFGHARRE